eukprot:gene67483-biopygen49565
MLNRRKGAAVQGPRTQADRKLYRLAMQSEIFSIENLTVIEGDCTHIDTNDNRVVSVTRSKDTGSGRVGVGTLIVGAVPRRGGLSGSASVGLVPPVGPEPLTGSVAIAAPDEAMTTRASVNGISLIGFSSRLFADAPDAPSSGGTRCPADHTLSALVATP